jgi:hypothetical protein
MSPVIASSIPILYILLQWSALNRMRAGWRAAALFPVLLMTFALAATVVGIASNASLAPLALVLGLPVATLYLLVLLPLHMMLSSPR